MLKCQFCECVTDGRLRFNDKPVCPYCVTEYVVDQIEARQDSDNYDPFYPAEEQLLIYALPQMRDRSEQCLDRARVARMGRKPAQGVVLVGEDKDMNYTAFAHHERNTIRSGTDA